MDSINREDRNVKVLNIERSAVNYTRPIFGTDLTSQLNDYKISLPFVITKCIAEIESRGLTTAGLYRINGSAEEINTIVTAFENDKDQVNLSQERYPDVHAITGVFKSYLNKLPEPLITSTVWTLLVNVIDESDLERKLESVRQAILSLPKAHYDILEYVIAHLNRVSLCADANKMNSRNLAMIFAFTLTHSLNTDLSKIDINLRIEIALTELLILHYKSIFNCKS